ncbi:unnamed protein product [Trichogramma brassicae]|uniref:Integrase catalytic domain-containing protein n=1 Tax=Trichogramma brassicae TaxID=86971 RepID=A0A6H5HYJ5_9HYME|nr:unnamed protein product [Trichogramma brassicae]
MTPSSAFPATVDAPWNDEKLADAHYNKPGPIELLIGADVLPLLLRPGLLSHCDLAAQNTFLAGLFSVDNALAAPERLPLASLLSKMKRPPSGTQRNLLRYSNAFGELEDVSTCAADITDRQGALRGAVRPSIVCVLRPRRCLGMTILSRLELRALPSSAARLLRGRSATSSESPSIFVLVRRTHARFSGRRGAPAEIWSDNGAHFHRADPRAERSPHSERIQWAQISDRLAANGTSWRFIPPPRAPHFGGLWEGCSSVFP